MTTNVPTGKLDLWEYGRRKLGYGDYNAATTSEPYQKWAGLEAHKLSLTMKKRDISNADFVLCVDYCHAMRLRIENPVWVFKFLSDARVWAVSQKPDSDLATRINNAIARERALADAHSEGWVSRLARARGPYREEVLTEWAQQRNAQ